MDKERLKKSRLQEREHDIPGVGTVRVRALNREEALKLQGKEMDVAQAERIILSMAMLDPADMTEEDIAEWQAASPMGELQELTEVIAEMSGMTAKYDKQAYQQFRGSKHRT